MVAPKSNAASSSAYSADRSPTAPIGARAPDIASIDPIVACAQGIDLEYLESQSQQRLMDYVEASSDWFWELNQDLKIKWLSSNVKKNVCVKPRIVCWASHIRIWPVIAPPNPDWSYYEQTLQQREPLRDFEYPLATPTGVRWVRISGIPLIENGEFRGYRGVAKDTTDVRAV